MQTVAVEIPRKQARELYREYKKHVHYSQPMDREIMRAYQLMAQGRVIIKALESIRKAGVNDQALPKLAICRADQQVCTLQIPYGGAACSFHAGEVPRFHNASRAFGNQFVFRDWPEIIGWTNRKDR
ncbi:MAG TPA: hypothetical protein VHN20_10820, partial [Beijerinckiaceae bacterium]|nr:hypothetical protein [Beijerinckiaceae bacterium]